MAFYKWIKRWKEENSALYWIIIIGSIVFLFALFLCMVALYSEFLDKRFVVQGDNLAQNPVNSYEVDAVLYFLTGMGTVVLVIVAYIQLKGLFNNSKADMLLRIDKNFRNPEALRAKSIILQFTFEVQEEIPDKEECCTKLKKKIITDQEEEISKKILKFIKTPANERTDQIILINFLNSIEATCYLCNEKYISTSDIREFYQYEIPRYFRLYEEYINYKEICYENAYKEIKKLYIEIKGYDFCLISDLPNNNSEEAKWGKIYFFLDGRSYCVRNLQGIIRNEILPKELGITPENLSEKLKDEKFKSDFLKIAHKAGLTLKKELKLALFLK